MPQRQRCRLRQQIKLILEDTGNETRQQNFTAARSRSSAVPVRHA